MLVPVVSPLSTRGVVAIEMLELRFSVVPKLALYSESNSKLGRDLSQNGATSIAKLRGAVLPSRTNESSALEIARGVSGRCTDAGSMPSTTNAGDSGGRRSSTVIFVKSPGICAATPVDDASAATNAAARPSRVTAIGSGEGRRIDSYASSKTNVARYSTPSPL